MWEKGAVAEWGNSSLQPEVRQRWGWFSRIWDKDTHTEGPINRGVVLLLRWGAQGYWQLWVFGHAHEGVLWQHAAGTSLSHAVSHIFNSFSRPLCGWTKLFSLRHWCFVFETEVFECYITGDFSIFTAFIILPNPILLQIQCKQRTTEKCLFVKQYTSLLYFFFWFLCSHIVLVFVLKTKEK